MRVGFTGTRKGMSETQRKLLRGMLARLSDPADIWGTRAEFHFGGAEGADLEARLVAKDLNYVIHWRPCPGVALEDLLRTGAVGPEAAAEFWHPVGPPLVRNRHIVLATEVLIAAPLQDAEQLRSGTWATVRYARAAPNPIVMLPRGQR